MAAKLDDLSVKTALYHHERGRVYRPTKLELETNRFSCPRCGTDLTTVKIRLNETALSCPSCRWSIHRDDLWKPQPEQEPAVRAPGEATEELPAMEAISVADTMPELLPTEVVLS